MYTTTLLQQMKFAFIYWNDSLFVHFQLSWSLDQTFNFQLSWSLDQTFNFQLSNFQLSNFQLSWSLDQIHLAKLKYVPLTPQLMTRRLDVVSLQFQYRQNHEEWRNQPTNPREINIGNQSTRFNIHRRLEVFMKFSSWSVLTLV